MTADPEPCDPEWRDQPADTDDTPSPGLLRVHEIADQRCQGARPLALWTATDIPPGSYL